MERFYILLIKALFLLSFLIISSLQCAEPSSIVFNEILFKEKDGNQEWVELFNKTDLQVEMKDFYIIDAAGNKTRFNGVIKPQQYIVVCRDKEKLLQYYPHIKEDNVIESTSWARLNNDKETLYLKDSLEETLDVVTYTATVSFPHDFSIERINPFLPATDDNWGQSIAPQGSTPGFQNSIYTLIMPAKTSLQISQNPFSPSRGESTMFNFEFPERLNRVSCRIFDLKGRLVSTPLNQQVQAAKGHIPWDGYKDDGSKLPIGIYIVTIEAVGQDSESIYSERKAIVIAN